VDLVQRDVFAKFGKKPYPLAQLNINDPDILDAIRLGNREALKIITPALTQLIKTKLYHHGLNTREIRDTIFSDVFLDLHKKEYPIVLKQSPMEFLSGMVDVLIKRYVMPSKLVLLDNEIMSHFPDLENMEEKETLNILWLKIQPFLLKLPGKSRDLMIHIHDGQSILQICKELSFKDERTFYSRKSQSIFKLKKLIERSTGNHWLKKKLL